MDNKHKYDGIVLSQSERQNIEMHSKVVYCGKENSVGFKLTCNNSLPRGKEYYILVGSRVQLKYSVTMPNVDAWLYSGDSRSCNPSVVTVF